MVGKIVVLLLALVFGAFAVVGAATIIHGHALVWVVAGPVIFGLVRPSVVTAGYALIGSARSTRRAEAFPNA
jgi:hypothetical protein